MTNPSHVRIKPPVIGGLLALVMVVATFIIPAIGVLASFIIEEFGLSRTGFGWLVTSVAAATALASTATGRLTDRLGGRRVAVWLSVATACCLLGLAAARSFFVLLAVAMAAGVAGAAGNPATNRVIGEQFPEGRRGVTMGVKQSGVLVGFLVVGVTLPSLALGLGWRVALAAMAVVALFVALAATVLPNHPDTPATSGTAQRYRYPRSVRWIAWYALLMGTGGSALASFLPLYAQESLRFSPALAGVSVSVVGLTGILGRLWLGSLSDRLLRYSGLLTLLSLGAAGTMCLLLAAQLAPWLVWLAAALGGMTVVAWQVVAYVAAIRTSHPLTVGRASGLVNLGFMTGHAVTPIAFGALVDATSSYTLPWTVILVLGLAGALLMRRHAQLE